MGSSNLMLTEDVPTLLGSGCALKSCPTEDGLRLPKVSLGNGVQGGAQSSGSDRSAETPRGAQQSQSHGGGRASSEVSSCGSKASWLQTPALRKTGPSRGAFWGQRTTDHAEHTC